MPVIRAAVSGGNIGVGNGLYRSDMSLTIAANSDGNAGKKIAYKDQWCHWL